MNTFLNDLNFKHRFEIQTRFGDIDMMGHVNNASYFSYAEVARLDYYGNAIGFDSDWHKQHGLIMAKFEIDFKKAICFSDKVFVYTKCTRLGNTSFDLSWTITSIDINNAEEIAAEGETIIVCYDYRLKRPREIPVERRKLIEEFEK